MAQQAAARPLVTVRRTSKSEKIPLPHVLLAPIRPDIVHFVHTNMAKNRRQPYAVNARAGHQHSAESWGTGRAVARIPRVSGSGTNRAGQAAFGNMCRKGRMFAPTKIWRRWHRHINVNQRRYAVASALAASAIPALVMARGHRVAKVAEVPLVVGDEAQSIEKTRDAVKFLKGVNAYQDVIRARDSKKLRAGKGKLRNRRYVQRRGPLIVFNEDKGITRAFRNLPGVDLAHVERLNLLQLAPGGHLGRFVIWTKSAFQRLDSIWGTSTKSPKAKRGYNLPNNVIFNSDIARIINSDEVQSKVRPTIKRNNRYRLKKNPLKNLGVMAKLNPYILQVRRSELLAQKARSARKAARASGKKTVAPAHVARRIKNLTAFKKKHVAAKKAFYQRLVSEGDK